MKNVSWGWVLDWMWLCFLLMLLYYFFRERRQLKQSQSWFLTQGRITAVSWEKQGHTLWPKIEYTYYAFDTLYRGKQLLLNTVHQNLNSKQTRQLAYRVAVAYKNNEEIDVYVNPNCPNESVLDIAIPRKLYLILILLVVLILFHLSFMVYHFLGIDKMG